MSFALDTKTVLRSWARRMGLIPALQRVRDRLSLETRDYEARFGQAMLHEVRAGDCVWDVGANLGFYTLRFSDRVGSAGLVVAFEPAPGPFDKLVGLGRENVRAMNLALGDAPGNMPLTISGDPLGATHSLVAAPSNGAMTIDVRVAKGDELVFSERLRSPNVVKVDVEGFEEEVILGMEAELARPTCRALFCEVHFALLESRGRRHAPTRIEKRLRSLGFKTRWIDSSHIAARKPKG